MSASEQPPNFGRHATFAPTHSSNSNQAANGSRPVMVNFQQADVTPTGNRLPPYSTNSRSVASGRSTRTTKRDSDWLERGWWTKSRIVIAALLLLLFILFLIGLPLLLVLLTHPWKNTADTSDAQSLIRETPLLIAENGNTTSAHTLTELLSTEPNEATTSTIVTTLFETTTEETTDFPTISSTDTFNSDDDISLLMNSTDESNVTSSPTVMETTTTAITTSTPTTTAATVTVPYRIPRPPPVANCTEHGFVCADNLALKIGSNRVCDGVEDCSDGSDERMCRECRTSFSCLTTNADPPFLKCLRGRVLCDREDDCPNREDEAAYCGSKCSTEDGDSVYQCQQFGDAADEAVCIPFAWLCDGDAHCPLGDDEDSDVCKLKVCKNGARWCERDRFCIPVWHWCDGTPHCSDGSDESDCGCVECNGDGAVLCSEDPKGKCIQRNQICNDHDDCPNSEDEIGCPGYCQPAVPIAKLVCADGKSYPQRMACSGVVEVCNDACDECDTELSFRCANATKKCIPRRHLCDGIPHCDDASDELPLMCRCDTTDNNDEPEPVRCNIVNDHVKCLPAKFRCDGYHDCPDGSDENHCNSCYNSEVAFYCAMKRTCYPSSSHCDGIIDCPDYSDEDFCTCEACKSQLYRTYLCNGRQRCLRSEHVCNSRSQHHCPGNVPEDEQFCRPDIDFLDPNSFPKSLAAPPSVN